MTKKLFLVLVVIAALMISYSLVIGAKKASILLENDSQELLMKAPQPGPEGRADLVEGQKPKAAVHIPSGALPELPTKDKDVCDFWGEEAYYTSTGWFWGDEYLCNFQDPSFGYPYCALTDVFPMEVTEIWWEIYVGVATEFDWQGFIYANIGTDCPYPGDVICSTPVTHKVLEPGFYYLSAALEQPCCVYEPYFAGIYIPTDITANLASPIWGSDGLECQSYYQYDASGTWDDWVADYGYQGMVFVNSWGYTRTQNDCEELPICCQFDGYCDELTPQACIDAGGTPCSFNDARYECMGANCKFPWEPDTCTAKLICPTTIRLLAGETAEYDVTMKYLGAFPECFMITDPDPVAPGCVAVFDPNPLAYPDVHSTLTITTDISTPPGVYTFEVNGFSSGKGYTATLEVVAPTDQCEMFRDTESWAMFWSTVDVGDMLAVYYDPEALCPTCGDDVYPFKLTTVKAMFYNHNGYADHGDFTVHIYRATPNPCDGPQQEIYSFDVNNVTTTWTWLEFAVPEQVCTFGPFFVALEHTYDPGPDAYLYTCLLEDEPDCPMPECVQWWRAGGVWEPWEESGLSSTGYISLRAIGTCNEATCPQYECLTLSNTHGSMANYIKRPEPTAGRNYLNERFTAPSISSTLGKCSLLFWPAGTVGTPDLRVYVWQNDPSGGCNGGSVPGAVIDSLDIPAPVPVSPTWAEVDFYPLGITLAPNQEFHVGYTCPNYDPNVPTNQLGLVRDAGGYGSDRLSEYFGIYDCFENYPNIYSGSPTYDGFVKAEVCFDTPDFFVSPSPNYRDINAGDVTSYTVGLIPVLGYTVPIDLTVSGLPPTAGTATMTPTTVIPPGSSQLDVVTNPTLDACGTYVMTITATSGALVHQTTVKLRIKSPFNEEAMVNFNHGTQRTSNFGALANGSEADNFLWYDREAQLYDATLISAVPGDPQGSHLAMDLYDCEYIGFIADQPIELTHNPWCAGSSYEEYYGDVAYSHFYTTEDVISCEYDSLFVIGLKDVDCTDFSIKIKIYYNPTETPIPQLYAALYEDWDAGIGSSSPWQNWGDIDSLHNLMWQWDISEDSLVFGMMKAPFYDEFMHNITFVSNYNEVYAGSAHAMFDDCNDLTRLYDLMTTHIYRYPDYYAPDCEESECDFSQLMVAPPFSLNPGEKHIEIWIDFGRNLNDGLTWEQWYHKILRYAGFYRGDVDASDSLELPALDVSDLVYLVNYLYRGGPAPLPFADQGDVNGGGAGGFKDFNCPKNNVDVGDLVYLVNYVFRGGPPPVDYVRFIEQYWSRPSLFTNPIW